MSEAERKWLTIEVTELFIEKSEEVAREKVTALEHLKERELSELALKHLEEKNSLILEISELNSTIREEREEKARLMEALEQNQRSSPPSPYSFSEENQTSSNRGLPETTEIRENPAEILNDNNQFSENHDSPPFSVLIRLLLFAFLGIFLGFYWGRKTLKRSTKRQQNI